MLIHIGSSITHRKNDLIDLCEQALQYVVLLESVNQLACLLIDAMRALLQVMTADRDEVVISQRARGRPRLNIEEEQIQFLVESNFWIVDIAVMFGCSSSTIQRRQ